MTEGHGNIFSRHQEKFTLLGYFGIMLVLTPSLARLFGSAWENGHLIPSLLELRFLVGVNLQAISALFFGLFVALLALMTIDPKKRWQGYLLWIGLAIALLGLQSMNLFIPNIDFVGHVAWLGMGLVGGLFVGGGRQLIRTQNTHALELRKAARGIYIIVAALIIGSLLEYHLVYPEFLSVSADGVALLPIEEVSVSINNDGLMRNGVVALIFVVTIKRFVQYDSEEDFFVLGPPGSGKSLFLIGAYLEALNRDRDKDNQNQTPLQPSQDLMEMVEQLDRSGDGWIVDATGRGEIKRLSFQYVYGSIFPKNVYISSIDYAGEYLSRLPDALTGAVVEEDSEENALWRVSQGVKEADTLVLLVDVERFINENKTLDIAEYFSILQAAGNKNAIIVATKADALAEQFRKEKAIEAHVAYDEFKTYVEHQLRQSEQVDTLFREVGTSEITPVYYQTTYNKEGERVPMRDQRGSVMTIGFDHLLSRLGR